MRNMSGLNEFIKHLTDYFENECNILTVYIFGSFGTDRQTPLSDIDIAILFDGDVPIIEELKHAAEISSIFKTDMVDVINLNTAPVYLQHEVLYSGTKIYERIPDKTMDFVESVLEEYHDYEIILKKFRTDFEQQLQEEYIHG